MSGTAGWQTRESGRYGDEAAYAGWPGLTGSPNAVDWALSIRRRQIRAFDDAAQEYGDDDIYGSPELWSAVCRAVRRWMLSQQEAAFWVDNRTATPPGWVVLADRADETTRALFEQLSPERAGGAR